MKAFLTNIFLDFPDEIFPENYAPSSLRSHKKPNTTIINTNIN